MCLLNLASVKTVAELKGLLTGYKVGSIFGMISAAFFALRGGARAPFPNSGWLSSTKDQETKT